MFTLRQLQGWGLPNATAVLGAAAQLSEDNIAHIRRGIALVLLPCGGMHRRRALSFDGWHDVASSAPPYPESRFSTTL